MRLETRLISRDRGAIVTTLTLAVLLVTAFLAGLRADQSETSALKSAAQQVQAEWNAQPPVNPHMAAHYGILVYRPRAPLQAIDAGALPYQGSVTFLEAHKRNAPMLSPASVRNADSRYGGTRFSPLLQIAGGFLVLVLGFLIGSREARHGMTPLLRGAGVRGTAFVGAKALATLGLVVLAAAPSIVFAALTIGGGDPGARFAALASASLIHLMILASAGVAAGLWLGAARFGLAAITFVWAMSVMILPRIADTVAERVAPLTERALTAQIQADFALGPDGHGENDANALFEKRVLVQYGVTRKEDLPVNLDALLMQADEDYRGSVYDRRLAEADAVRQRQDAIRSLAWAFGPTPAMLDLSERIAGADASTQRRFDVTAEAFRRDLIGRLNRHMAENSRTGDWEWTPADRYFASFTAFNPTTPRLRNDLPGLMPAAATLSLWAAVAGLALLFAARRFDRSAQS
ncbi:DUF3526 domain-containing protein [Rhizorhabdus sp. FW153]|uniref:DUF3526 domain-containing protein n=1 Tax=Rhizorhabdus sp. FW153 TaxID=3400216 RepID=UPI003CF3A068